MSILKTILCKLGFHSWKFVSTDDNKGNCEDGVECSRCHKYERWEY